MTDRHAGYIVTLDKSIREDDAQSIISAIQMIKGVLSVKPIVDNIEIHIAEQRARNEILGKLSHFINEASKF